MTTKRRNAGRKPQSLVRSFVAAMVAKLYGKSHKRALELIEQSPDDIPGSLWALAAEAQTSGVSDLEAFDQWLRQTISERLSRPTL